MFYTYINWSGSRSVDISFLITVRESVPSNSGENEVFNCVFAVDGGLCPGPELQRWSLLSGAIRCQIRRWQMAAGQQWSLSRLGSNSRSKTSSGTVGNRFIGASVAGSGVAATSSFSDSFGASSNIGSNNAFSVGGSFSSAKKTKTGFSDSSDAGKIGIKEDTRQLNDDGSYYYKVVNENNIEVSESGRVDNVGTDDEVMRVKGYYEYIGDDGVLYRVDYIADENGFQPTAAHLPTPPPIPEEILRSIRERGLARK
nr:pupal cuticle protein 20-like [Aedes albopictus]